MNQNRPEINYDDELNALGFSVAAPVFVDILENNPSPVQPPATEAIRLPAVSIATVTGSVEEGSTADFGLSASMPVETELTANITQVDIDSFIGGSTSRTMDIAEDSDAGELSEATISDDHAGKDDRRIATVADGNCYEDSSDSNTEVVVMDHVDREDGRAFLSGANQAVLSDFLGSHSARTLETVANRVTSTFSEGTGIKLELGGSTKVKDFINEYINIINGGKMDSWQELLGDSSFKFELFPEEGTSNSVTVWRYGDFHDIFAGGEGAGELDGGMFTGQFGFDTLIGGDMVAGAATSPSRGELDYGIAEDKALSCTTTTTGVHSYLGVETSVRNRLQVIAGYNLSGIELAQQGCETEMLDSSCAGFGVSGNRVLYSSDSLLFGGTSELTVDGESWMPGQFLSNGSEMIGSMRIDACHLRNSTVGTHEYELEGGSTVSISVSMGLREDGKLGESFLGMEVGSGIALANNHGYEISTKGEVLFTGTDQILEWGTETRFDTMSKFQRSTKFVHGNHPMRVLSLQGHQKVELSYWKLIQQTILKRECQL